VAKASTQSGGNLYVIATPIGNLGDLGSRARELLGSVDLVAAEDTRRSGRLLQHLGLDARLVSLHEHNEDAQTANLIAELEAGRSVALISDAGTPLISDPGLRLVAGARASGIPVIPIPGPSAITAALSVSGLATDRFVFEGFLPRKESARRERLKVLSSEPRTLVFFEAVHRIQATVADLSSHFGPDRDATLARELTKLHEQIITGRLADLDAALGQRIPLRGEFVIVVAGRDAEVDTDDAQTRRVYGLLAEALPPSDAVTLCARITGRSRNDVYALTRRR